MTTTVEEAPATSSLGIDNGRPVFLRSTPDKTLGDTHTELLRRSGRVDTIPIGAIEFHLDSNEAPGIQVGNDVLPATSAAVEAFANRLQVPTSFLDRYKTRVGLGAADDLLNNLLSHSGVPSLTVRTSTDGEITGVYDGGKQPLEPSFVTKALKKVMGHDDSPVVRVIDTPAAFSIDVALPGSVKPLGDAKKGDIMSRGLRATLDMKRGLAPSVEEFAYRLACTNGMTFPEPGLKIDGRGQTIEEVMVEFELMCQRAFEAVEANVNHFYDLRNNPVDNPERFITRVAEERGIPTRTTMGLIRLAATDHLPDSPSEFDLVNLMTNYANSPAIHNDGGRLILERAGGGLVVDSAARCGHCQTKIA